MNKKIITAAAIFTAGIAIGAIASEVASNGLYIFKPGDPISSSEVNSNFDLLNKKIESLEYLNFVLDRPWDCTGDDGGVAYIWYLPNGIIYNSTLYSSYGSATSWEYDLSSDSFTVTADTELTFSISIEPKTSLYEIRITPEDTSLESFGCTRGA